MTTTGRAGSALQTGAVLFLKGMVIGVANIIPGVSGGTMALVLGLYDRLIRALGRFRARSVSEMVRAFTSEDRRRRLVEIARDHDLLFLGLLGAGAAAAVVALSGLMTYLLDNHHAPTYGFFLGLVAASIPVPYCLLKRRSSRELLSALVAIALAIGLSEAVSPEQRLERARVRATLSEHPKPIEGAPAGEVARDPTTRQAPAPPAGRPPAPLHSPGRLAFIFLAGMLAISAMILPGVSGSFLLLVLGVYFDVLRAIHDLDALLLGTLALGCLTGLVVFVKLLAFLLERVYSQTMAFLAGLMVGSLWGLWPFKETAQVGSTTVYLDNTWPAGVGAEVLATTAAAVLGAGASLGFFFLDRMRKRRAPSEPNGSGTSELRSGS